MLREKRNSQVIETSNKAASGRGGGGGGGGGRGGEKGNGGERGRVDQNINND